MKATETIFVHKACNSQMTRLKNGQIFCEVCNRRILETEVSEVDNSPSPFAG